MTSDTATTSATLAVAFVVPLQGPTGIYGPSCLACGELAVEQLNAADGIGGRRVELVVVDAGRPPHEVADEVARLVDSGRVQAVAGWHISAVRVAVAPRVAGKVVYAYAAMHEGHDDTPGVFMLGERPTNQLLPAAAWMREQLGLRRWVVIGNDYVYPRVTGATARFALEGSGSQVVRESYVPLGTTDFRAELARLDPAHVDGVMVLLMGQDAVHFNRQFATAGLAPELARLSPVVEENQLLAGGMRSNEGLYVAAAFFEELATAESTAFSRTYYQRFGALAPHLNAIGESCYEAVQFLARLSRTCGSLDLADVLTRLPEGHFYDSPRGLVRVDGNLVSQDVHLARAEGLRFEVQEQISRTE